MEFLLSQTIFAYFILALYFSFHVLRTKEMKYIENRILCLCCFFSAIWSLGFYGVIIQSDPQKAYFWRGLGMIGVFAYLIFSQMLVGYLCEIKKIYRQISNVIAFSGIFLYFFVICYSALRNLWYNVNKYAEVVRDRCTYEYETPCRGRRPRRPGGEILRLRIGLRRIRYI